MKESKFWIWFIPLLLITCVGIYFMLTKNNTNNQNNNTTTDAIKIKEEYSKNNDKYYSVKLSDTNVYKYIKVDELKELLNKKDGLVFIGNANDNITRKNLYVLNDVVSSTSVAEVFYIDIKDINDDLDNLLKEKTQLNAIKEGTLIAIEGGRVLNAYYPSTIADNKDLTDNEKDSLNHSYRDIVKKFIEECDENC